ncbi:hypothetical protein CFAM422_007788 [Trichoderma lentiforme]|uniref:Uncharacterized protein n=1 Tax=Trichoderma lentiforme TaxID=1567552 RepID=A0A9P4XCW4_9HYPO|nr:hypothetical protein CFAM422_007788 [Trichoderma lentiforme]
MAPKLSAPHAPLTRSQNKRQAKEPDQEPRASNSILNYFSKLPTGTGADEPSETVLPPKPTVEASDSAPTTETQNGQVVICEKDSGGPNDEEGEEDLKEADIPETNTIEEEEPEESARMARTEQIQIMLDEMGLPSDIFDPEAHTNWLGILLDVSMASDETKEAILDFSKRIQNMMLSVKTAFNTVMY